MKWLLALLLIPLLLLAAALAMNRAPLGEPPGLLARLKLYLTHNQAHTRRDHERPELRPLVLSVSESQARAWVRQAMQRLGWRQIEDQGHRLRAVVVTPLLRFRDDVEVRLESSPAGILIQVSSRSRIGKGDLGANTAHIRELYRAIDSLRDSTAAHPAG